LYLLAEYDFVILTLASSCSVPGKANVVADALSRKPCTLNALIQAEQPALFKEFEDFGLELVSHGYLANLELTPTLMDQIKEA